MEYLSTICKLSSRKLIKANLKLIKDQLNLNNLQCLIQSSSKILAFKEIFMSFLDIYYIDFKNIILEEVWGDRWHFNVGNPADGNYLYLIWRPIPWGHDVQRRVRDDREHFNRRVQTGRGWSARAETNRVSKLRDCLHCRANCEAAAILQFGLELQGNGEIDQGQRSWGKNYFLTPRPSLE